MWLVMLLGCWGTDTQEALDEEHVLAEMGDHWDEAATARDALVQGDLPAAGAALRTVALRLPVEGLPEEWTPMQQVVRERAIEAASADTLPEAASAFGRMARACGQCHAVADATLAVQDRPVPTEPMARHAWAAERLWRGLVRPSGDDLGVAVGALTSEPLLHGELPAEAPWLQRAAELETRVRDLAVAVRDADTPDAQAARYGDLLASCSACHGAVE